MQKFNVTGMSCAACVARVEKAVNGVAGVQNCAVSLLTNSMRVEGSAEAAAVIAAVEAAGYGASVVGATNGGRAAVNAKSSASYGSAGGSANVAEGSANVAGDLALALRNRETPMLKRRLVASLVFLLPLLYVSMGHMMLDWPLPGWFTRPAANHVAMGIVQMLLAGVVLVINQKFFVNGFKGLWHRTPNMDSLVALGSGASYVYSVGVLLAMSRGQVLGGVQGAEAWMDHFYFEGAATIVTLITVGKLLESISKGRTTDALKSLMNLAPKTATILDECSATGTSANGSAPFVERTVPVEQVTVDQIFVVKPGETVPVDGVVIEGASAIDEAALTGESLPVDKSVGSTVTAATLNQSGFLKCKATRVGEDTTLSQIIQMVSDAAATKAPMAKIADKVAGVFVPVVIGMALMTLAVWLLVDAEFGFALARAIAVLVISCPCALGLATPVAIMVGNGVGAKNGILYKTSAALESRSEHPLAKAVLEYAGFRGKGAGESAKLEGFEALPGQGLQGLLNGAQVFGGNLNFVESKVHVPDAIGGTAAELSAAGKTPLFFCGSKKFLGLIAVADVLKPDSKIAVEQLRELGLRVVMLTGDNERTARSIASQVGIGEMIADVLPGGKDAAIQNLKTQGKVAMVGDGINDAPALTRADVGVAIGAGADVAIDAADVVLMKSSLQDVSTAIRLSRTTNRNIRENLFWAFIYNVVGIPLAAGCYYKLFGWSLNATFAALAMSPRCEAHVKKAIEAVDGVVEAKASHEKATVEVSLEKDVSADAIKAAVVDAGYEFMG